MAATNIFYRLPSQRGTRIASIAGTQCGKGGFGSLLRAIGAQIEKTTNRDACRDLSGRRLRDIKREDELRKLLELREKLEQEKIERKKEKLEKLKKQSEKSQTSASIQELVSMFDDHAFNKRRLELGEILDAAVEKGLINAKKREMDENDARCNKKSKIDHSRENGRVNDEDSARQTKTEEQGIDLKLIGAKNNEPVACDKALKKQLSPRVPKKSDLWLGLEDDDDEEDDDVEQNSHAPDFKTAISQR